MASRYSHRRTSKKAPNSSGHPQAYLTDRPMGYLQGMPTQIRSISRCLKDPFGLVPFILRSLITAKVDLGKRCLNPFSQALAGSWTVLPHQVALLHVSLQSIARAWRNRHSKVDLPGRSLDRSPQVDPKQPQPTQHTGVLTMYGSYAFGTIGYCTSEHAWDQPARPDPPRLGEHKGGISRSFCQVIPRSTESQFCSSAAWCFLLFEKAFWDRAHLPTVKTVSC